MIYSSTDKNVWSTHSQKIKFACIPYNGLSDPNAAVKVIKSFSPGALFVMQSGQGEIPKVESNDRCNGY